MISDSCRFRTPSSRRHVVWRGSAVLGIAVAIAVAIPGASQAEPEFKRYTSQGAVATATIVDARTCKECCAISQLGEDHPVHFCAPRSFPNPFSSPTVAFSVVRRSTFALEVFEVGGGLLDSFHYADVDSGVYFFLIPRAVWRGPHQTAFVLRSAGARADSVDFARALTH